MVTGNTANCFFCKDIHDIIKGYWASMYDFEISELDKDIESLEKRYRYYSDLVHEFCEDEDYDTKQMEIWCDRLDFRLMDLDCAKQRLIDLKTKFSDFY